MRRLSWWGGLIATCALLLLTTLPLRAEIAAIHVYQRIGSPVAGCMVTCRFEPSCSEYALIALSESGFLKGNLRLAKRLVLCSPLGLVLE